MNMISKCILALPVCCALQACSSASDMEMSPVMPDSSAAMAPVAVQPVPQPEVDVELELEVEVEPDTGAAEENPESSNDNVPSPYNAIAPELVENASNISCDAPTAEFQSTMLAMINESRLASRMCGTTSHPAVTTVTWNNQLTEAAMAHADDMVTFNFFDHDGSDGLSVANRADTAGYNWRAVGENIAAGQLDIAEVHQGWVDSPGHCRNIMNTLYSEVGAACIVAENNDYGSYWVVVFGDQP